MENNTTQAGNVLRQAIFDEPAHTIIIILFVFISAIGTTLNCFVILLIIKIRQLHTPLNYLLLNLSIADLIGGLGAYPYFFLDVSRTNIRGGSADVLCSFSTGVVVFFICSGESVLTLCAISFSRFLSINFPMRPSLKIEKRGCFYFIAISWVLSTMLLIPNCLSLGYEVNTGYCYRFARKGMNMNAYNILTIVFGTVLPISLMSLTYFATWRQLWHKSQNNSDETMRGTIRSRKKVMVLLGLLIATYLVCWSPFYIYRLLAGLLKIYPDTEEGRIKIFRLYTIAILFGLCNSTTDPIIYTLRGEQFKKEIRRIFGRNNRLSNFAGQLIALRERQEADVRVT